MVDHKRIKTGYDLELLFGSAYFLNLIRGAYKAGEIPDRIDMPGSGPLFIGQPSQAFILSEDTEADLQVAMPYGLREDALNAEADIFVSIAIERDGIAIRYRRLDENTRQLIIGIGQAIGRPNLLQEVEDSLRRSLGRKVPIELLSSQVAELETRKVPQQGEYQDAYGVYVNLNIKVAPQPGPPEKEYTKRGDLSKAVSFLPKNRALAVGIAKETFTRFANSQWHAFAVFDPQGNVSHPFKLNGNEMGEHISVAVEPRKDTIRATSKLWSRVPGVNLNADVTSVLDIKPVVKEGVVEFDTELVQLDLDTGAWGDFLGGFFGALLGGLIGALTGNPIGFVVGMGIGAGSGIATIEIAEAVMEGELGGQVEEGVKRAGITSVLSAFPVRLEVFVDERDPFFDRHYILVHYFREVDVDEIGMSMTADATWDPYNVTEYVTIVGVNRGVEAGNVAGVTAIWYYVEGHGIIELPMKEILKRIQNRELIQADIEPSGIHRKKTVIKEIMLKSSAVFRVPELMALHKERVLAMPGFQFIYPKHIAPYIRHAPDGKLENNLEWLPRF
jgi:hypothetical protein